MLLTNPIQSDLNKQTTTTKGNIWAYASELSPGLVRSSLHCSYGVPKDLGLPAPALSTS